MAFPSEFQEAVGWLEERSDDSPLRKNDGYRGLNPSYGTIQRIDGGQNGSSYEARESIARS